MKNRLLLLGGTNSAEELRNYADAHNITLIAIGTNKNSVLKKYAHESYTVDVFDTENFYCFIEEKNISGIFIGSNEKVVPQAINACTHFHFPCYCSLEQWACCTDKTTFKKMCSENSIPVSETYTPDELKANPSLFPVIVKPSDSCGSQGFSLCKQFGDLQTAIEKASAFSDNQKLLIEKFQPYDAVVIHYTLINGQIMFSGISDKVSMRLNQNGSSVMAFQKFPSDFIEMYLKELDHKVKNMFMKNGFHDGPIWIEAFNNNGRFIFNEMGYRFGGSMTYYPIRYFHKVDQLELLIKYSLNEPHKNKEPYYFLSKQKKSSSKKKYCILPLHINAGTISSIDGENYVKNMDCIYAYVPIHFEGDTIQKSGTVDQVFCYLHILFDEYSDLKINIEKILDHLHVYDKTTKNLLFCLFDYTLL